HFHIAYCIFNRVYSIFPSKISFMVEHLNINKFKNTRQIQDVTPKRRLFFYRHNGHIIEATEGKSYPYQEEIIYKAEKQTRKLRLERAPKYQARELLPPVPEGPR